MISKTAFPRTPSHSQSVESLLADVTDEFIAALRDGEPPDIESFVRRYPQIAAILRTVLPALAEIHRTSGEETSPSQPSDAVAGRLGDFAIRREIGRGGMGIVYEAEQLSLSRRVALKVLPFAAVLDERQLARFKNEARAAATLHHTNIVPVFSVGCERGVHFYAMQFIEGQSLAQVVDELRRVAGAERSGVAGAERSEAPAGKARGAVSRESRASHPNRSSFPTEAFSGANPQPLISNLQPLPSPSPVPADTIHDAAATILTQHSSKSPAFYRSIARLGIQAAEALEHAHQYGVIHRDIKPANLMLDQAGNLWIADFGLARLETDAGMTMTGDLIGTLRYMSPEQTLGKRVVIDHRTDIYSLGATLYELLALAPPFDGADRAAIVRQIAFEEPQPLARRARRIPRELETIVHKALEKNPADRYQTAQALADDLRRFLEDRPIQAKRPALAARAKRWARRHKRSLIAAACIALLGLTGAGIAAGLVHQKRAELTTQQEEKREAELAGQQGLDRIERALNFERRGAFQSADSAYRDAVFFLERLCARFPDDLEYAADHLAARFHYVRFLARNGPDREVAELLPTVVAACDRLPLDGDVRQRKRVYWQLGACFFHLGELLVERGDEGTAISLFLRAQEFFASLAPDFQDAQARCLFKRGMCLEIQSRPEEARILYRQALPLLAEWNATFATRPTAGAWQWSPYPDMFYRSGVDLYIVFLLHRAILCQRLGEDAGGTLTLVHAGAGGSPHPAALPLIQEAAALFGENDLADGKNGAPPENTFAARLLTPAVKLLRSAEAALDRGDAAIAYTLFGDAIDEAKNANIDVREHGRFQQIGARLGPRGNRRFADYVRERASLGNALAVQMPTGDRTSSVLVGFDSQIGQTVGIAQRRDLEAAYDMFDLTLFQSSETRVPISTDATFRRALKLLGDRASKRFAAHQHIVAGKYRQAAEIADQIAAEHPEDHRSHWLRGFAYARLEGVLHREGKHDQAVAMLDQAIASYRQSIALAPDSHRSYADLAWLFCNAATVRRRDPVEALELAKKSSRLEGGSFTAMLVPAIAYYRLGDFSKARKQFNAFFLFWQNSPWKEPCTEAGFVAAMTERRLGNEANAQKRFRATVEVLRKYGIPDDEAEPQRLRSEAAAMLGMTPGSTSVDPPRSTEP